MNLHALFNALLNATCATLLVLGYRAIKRREIERHKRFMLSAFTVSCVFLVSYLARFALAGGATKFAHEGAWKAAYLGILFSHMALAAIVPVFAIRSILLGLKDRRVDHRWWSTKTFPMWLYVSVTGVLVYVMLYVYPGP
jgi:uncharacterized membrane protein YozB (DUF420 family)